MKTASSPLPGRLLRSFAGEIIEGCLTSLCHRLRSGEQEKTEMTRSVVDTRKLAAEIQSNIEKLHGILTEIVPDDFQVWFDLDSQRNQSIQFDWKWGSGSLPPVKNPDLADSIELIAALDWDRLRQRARVAQKAQEEFERQIRETVESDVSSEAS